MSRKKERLTITLDAELVRAGHRAVRAGTAESLSAWINDALAEREIRQQRLHAMSEAVAAYEAAFGALSREELAAQQRADERAATVVRGTSQAAGKRARARARSRAA